MLRSIEDNAKYSEIVKILHRRFGSENQAERYRAELKARKRAKNESLQTLFMIIAYPNMSNEMSDIVGRDAFLDIWIIVGSEYAYSRRNLPQWTRP